MKKRRVCCFCEKWESGGIESFLHNVLMHMDLSAMAVDIVAAKLSDSVFTVPLKERGVQFFELSGNPNNLPANHRKFRRLLKEREYDVVHVNAFHGLSLKYLDLARKANVPVRIAHSHNTGLRDSRTKKLKMVLHAIGSDFYAGSATHIWACSRKAAEFLYPMDMLIEDGYGFVPNGIDTERFRFNPEIREQVREELGLKDCFVVGNVGRLCYQKNQEFLLDVFAEICRARPQSRLLLVGDGEMRGQLEEKAKQLKITDKVIFYGLSTNVEELMWAMDAFVMPSYFEGLPVTAVEAQAAGLPCVFADAITKECALLPETRFCELSESTQAWSKEILNLQSTDRFAASAVVENKGFGIQSVSDLIKQVYELVE